MFTKLTENNWRDFLPSAYPWVGSVEVGLEQNFTQATLTIVPVKQDANKNITVMAKCFSDDQLKEITQACKALDWKGQDGRVQFGTSFGQIALVLMSSLNVSKPQISRQCGLDAATLIKGRSIENVAICAAGDDFSTADILEGFFSALYDQQLFKGPNTRSQAVGLPKKITLFARDLNPENIAEKRCLVQASYVTRMLQDAPANILTPEAFALIAKSIATESGHKVKILGRSEMEKEGMGSFLSVANGSPLDPKMIVVEIDGEDSSKCVSLVGKGLTFDAGGISIKPAAGMDEMKFDMSGGAAVMGALHYFSHNRPATKLYCLIGAVENMCSGTATRPGDVVVASNGKSIEVQNTDAEGRLVLADVLSYTVKYHKPELIIDAATLTGSALHALGHCGAAMMSNDDDTADFVMHAAQEFGEPLWRLPLWAELDREIKGTYGDLANIPKPNVKAGTIIGGIFLKEFVEDTKWVHLDIAGTAWSCMATGYTGGSGSGFGLRTMIASVLRFGK